MGEEAFLPGFGFNFFAKNDFGEFNGLFQTLEGGVSLVPFKLWSLSAALFVFGDEFETAKNLAAYLLLAILVILSVACFLVMLESEEVDGARMAGEPGGKFGGVTRSYECTGRNGRHRSWDLG